MKGKQQSFACVYVCASVCSQNISWTIAQLLRKISENSYWMHIYNRLTFDMICIPSTRPLITLAFPGETLQLNCCFKMMRCEAFFFWSAATIFLPLSWTLRQLVRDLWALPDHHSQSCPRVFFSTSSSSLCCSFLSLIIFSFLIMLLIFHWQERMRGESVGVKEEGAKTF